MKKYLLIISLLFCSANIGLAAEKFLIQVGYEENLVELINTSSGDSVGTLSGPLSFSTNSKPVFSIASKTFLSDFGCFEPYYIGEDEDILAACQILGFGFRFSGSQKRLAGNWFPLESNPDETVAFEYNSTQFAGEFLIGSMSNIIPVVAVGVRAGINNYDLLISQNETILAKETDNYNTFVSTTGYLNIGMIAFLLGYWPSTWPFNKLTIEMSTELSQPGQNVIEVGDINGGGRQKIDIRTKTSRVVLQIIF